MEIKTVLLQSVPGHILRHHLIRDSIDFRLHETRRFTDTADDIHSPLVHRGVMLIGLVLIMFQMRVGVETVRQAGNSEVKINCLRQIIRRTADTTPVTGIFRKHRFNFFSKGAPCIIIFKKGREVPGILPRHFVPRGDVSAFTGGHMVTP